jgi:hypothetical protein
LTQTHVEEEDWNLIRRLAYIRVLLGTLKDIWHKISEVPYMRKIG